MTVAELTRSTRTISRTPTGVEREVHDALLDRWHTSGIVILQQQDAPGTVRIVTPIARGAIGLLTRFDHVDPLALGALHRHKLPSPSSLDK